MPIDPRRRMPWVAKVRMCLHHMPLLKMSIFQILPNQCIMPTKRRISGTGKRIMRVRTMMVKVPKQAMVPMPMATQGEQKHIKEQDIPHH
jgi:hypothetical protein